MLAVSKKPWGFTKVRYPGLEKNTDQPFVAPTPVNIYLVRGHQLS